MNNVEKIIVTSGQPFTDIDALACAIAYTELLKNDGFDAEAVLPGPLNKSVTEKIKKWNLEFEGKPSRKDASYILVDVSEIKYFANFVKVENIIEIYDHRFGFEDYWKNLLGKRAKIEPVGSCATLIWEEFKKRIKPLKISNISANLLITAIVSNTLNFKASVTTERDIYAFREIMPYTKIPNNWIKIYFTDQDNETDLNIRDSIINDTKDMEPIIGQLELWDSKKIILKHIDEIEAALKSFGSKQWFLTSPSISEGKNYLFTKDPVTKRLLEQTIGANFVGDIGTTNKLWLRKEIYKEIQLKK